MGGTTPNRGYPFPIAGEQPAGHIQIQDLALAVDADKVQDDLRYLNTNGDAATGYISVHADPTGLMHIANKRYVDARTAGYAQSQIGSFAVANNLNTVVPISSPDASGLTVASNVITIQTAGWWVFTITLDWSAAMSGTLRNYVDIEPISVVDRRARFGAGPGETFVTATGLYNLNAGLTVRFNCYQQSGASVSASGDWRAKRLGPSV